MLRDLIQTYHLLPLSAREELGDFANFLLQKQKSEPKEDYKNKLLKVSTWSENDLEVFDYTKNAFQEWNITNW